MGLYERLLRLEEPRIPVHAFGAALQERAFGNLTTAQIVAALALDAAAEAEIVALFATATGTTAQRLQRALEVENVLILAEAGYAFTSVASLKQRLGVS